MQKRKNHAHAPNGKPKLAKNHLPSAKETAKLTLESDCGDETRV